MTMASFKCADLGMKCGFEVKDADKDELMKIVALHAETTHKMKVSPELAAQVNKAIKP
jgi:predicted small metal-binding protein